MTIALIALAHGLVVFFVGIVSGSISALRLTAVVVILFAIFSGGIAYFVFDFIAIVIGYYFAKSYIELTIGIVETGRGYNSRGTNTPNDLVAQAKALTFDDAGQSTKNTKQAETSFTTWFVLACVLAGIYIFFPGNDNTDSGDYTKSINQYKTRKYSNERLIDSHTPTRETEKAAANPKPATDPLLVTKIQMRLKKLDYRVGQVDGIYGTTTRAAIISFEKQSGFKVTGTPTLKLLEQLDSEYQRLSLDQTNNIVSNPTKNGTYFTHGSTKQEVIDIQGKPNIIIDQSQYKETWKYGINAVYFSKQSQKVVGWRNNGGLKVKKTISDPRKYERIIGRWSNQVETLAINHGCTPDGKSSLLSVQKNTEYYQVFCADGTTLKVSCLDNSCQAHTGNSSRG